MAQIIKRGEQRYLIRVFLGRDDSGHQHYYNETVRASLTDARKKATALERRRDLGESIEPVAATFSEYLDEWLDVIRPRVAPRTASSYSSLIETHIKPAIGWKRVGALSPLDLEALYSSLEGKRSRRTIQYIHTVINAALRQAVRWRVIQHNPAGDTDHRIRTGKRQVSIQPFTEEELVVFLKHADADPYYAVFLVAVTSGLRPEEYLALKWSDFDKTRRSLKVERVIVRESGEWTFREPKTKSGTRTVPIPRLTVEALVRHKRKQNKVRIASSGYAADNLIFAGAEGQPLDANNLRNRNFHSILTAAKLESRRLYDLRHTWVTLSLAAGVDAKTVSEWAGHSSVAFTLDTYSKVIPSMKERGSEVLEKLFKLRAG